MLITKYISLFLLAAIKYFAAVLIFLADKSIDVYFTFFLLLFGGILGIVAFYYLGRIINIGINSFYLRWKKNKTLLKTGSKRNRRLIILKNKYGLIGISVLTPIFLSIPLGCFLASRFYGKKASTLFVMLAGIIGWTIVFTIIKGTLL